MNQAGTSVSTDDEGEILPMRIDSEGGDAADASSMRADATDTADPADATDECGGCAANQVCNDDGNASALKVSPIVTVTRQPVVRP